MSQLIVTNSQKIENSNITREIKNIMSFSSTEEQLATYTVADGAGEGWSVSDVGTPKVLIFTCTEEVLLTIVNTSGGTYLNIPTKFVHLQGSGWSTMSFSNTLSGVPVTASYQIYGALE